MKRWFMLLIPWIFLLSACTNVSIEAPAEDSKWIEGSDVDVVIEFFSRTPINTSSLRVSLNGGDISSLFAVSRDEASATLTDLGIDDYELQVSVKNTFGQQAFDSLIFQVVQGDAEVLAKRVLDEDDLIGGPMSKGKIGDYLLENSKIRVIIQDVGRDPLGFVSPYGGNIIDVDMVRAEGEPGNDNFMAMSPQINIESTFNATSIEVINDGSNGGAAIVRTTGVDDSLDYINASQMIKLMSGDLPLSVPSSADDKDIPAELVTEYTLNPGENYVKIETFIKNVGKRLLFVYIGDYIAGQGGELDLFLPGVGFGEPMVRLDADFITLMGEGSAEGIAYGYIPDLVKDSTSFTAAGVTVTSLGQSIIGVLLLGLPPKVIIAPERVYSYERYLAVAQDVAGILDTRNEIFNIDTGILQGTVRMAEEDPVEGATVSVMKTPGKYGADYDVLSAFRTDENGQFRGSLPPDNYTLMVAKEGYPYDSGSTMPNMVDVSISRGGLENVDLNLPETGALRVRSIDEGNDPIPAKASIVGFDPSPPLTNTQSVLGLLDIKGYVFDDPHGEDVFGVAKAIFLGPDGDSGEVLMEPGQYQLFISRGPEYSQFTETLTVSPGSVIQADAQIARVIDTAGFVSGDFHVHMINSPDSIVPKDVRVRTFLAEGVDYLVATDHEHLTDLGPTIHDLGAGNLISSSIGQEITPQDYGHFNGWPLSLNSDRRSMGAIDWGKEAPPGEDYRTLGAYCMSWEEIYQAVHDDPGEEIVQINHFNSGDGGGMNIMGIDTGIVPPQSTVDLAPFRLDPAITNLFSTDLDALELLIGNNREQVETFFKENLGDWFNLLNQGLIYTGNSDSDTHSRNSTQAGTFRNYIACSTDTPDLIDEDELTDNIKEGRTVGGYSPFLRATIHADSTEEDGGLALGLPKLISTTDGAATFHLEMQSPVWAEFDTVQLYINNIPDPVDDDGSPFTPPQYLANPNVVLKAGVDFTINEVDDFSWVPGARHLEAELEYTLVGLTEDTWIVAVVIGTDGTSKPLFPIVPNDLLDVNNETLSDLLDGNLGEGGMLSLSFTNPLFIDVDGNGMYDAPLSP